MQDILKRSQSEEAIYCMIPTIGHSGKGKTMVTVKASVIARDQGWGAGMNRQGSEKYSV